MDMSAPFTAKFFAPLPQTKIGVAYQGGIKFERTGRAMRISFVWGGGSFRNEMEILPVGPHRYALVHCDKPIGQFEARDLLTALRGFRQAAGWARDDRREVA